MSTKTHSRRVTFSHDHDDLLKPHPTVCVTFNKLLSPSELIEKGNIENIPVPIRKPVRRRLFGSLADLCAALDSDDANPLTQECDFCSRTYESDCQKDENPRPKYWTCQSCYDEGLK